MIWVVDASVAIRWFIQEEADSIADEVLERMVNEPARFAVPELFSFEVFSVLHRLHPDRSAGFQSSHHPAPPRRYVSTTYDRRTGCQSQPLRQIRADRI